MAPFLARSSGARIRSADCSWSTDAAVRAGLRPQCLVSIGRNQQAQALALADRAEADERSVPGGATSRHGEIRRLSLARGENVSVRILEPRLAAVAHHGDS